MVNDQILNRISTLSKLGCSLQGFVAINSQMAKEDPNDSKKIDGVPWASLGVKGA